MLRLIRNLVCIGIVLVLVYLFGIKGLRTYVIVSGSMQPTLKEGDRIITVRPDRINRNDIVILTDPRGSAENLVARVIGLPSETVNVTEKGVFINGEHLEEPYLTETPSYTFEHEVPPRTYVVLGDNRNNSEDSKDWELLDLTVEQRFIKRKVVCRYWPLNRIKRNIER